MDNPEKMQLLSSYLIEYLLLVDFPQIETSYIRCVMYVYIIKISEYILYYIIFILCYMVLYCIALYFIYMYIYLEL